MKMTYGSLGCTLSVSNNLFFEAPQNFDYEKDVVAYAVKRFFANSKDFRRDFNIESWEFRFAKGKEKKWRKFTYVIPAILMELPGAWVKVSGSVDAKGVEVQRVEVLEEYPWEENTRKERKHKR